MTNGVKIPAKFIFSEENYLHSNAMIVGGDIADDIYIVALVGLKPFAPPGR